MYLEDDILRFILLSETETREPEYVLFSILRKHSLEEVQSFLRMLVALVEEDMLHCDYWSRSDQKHYELKKGLLEKLRSYVEERIQKNQKLTSPPEGMPSFEFIVTEKGKSWLKQRYDNVESKGVEYINKIEEFRIAEKKYPTFIYELYPTYLAKIEEPSDIYGSWWYSVNKPRDSFVFGYFTYSGLLIVYDKEIKEWVRF